MPKQFWQCDVTDREDNIWTGSVIYGSHQEAEFATMLELQSDWGDSYMPDSFILAFGNTEDEDEPVLAAAEPVFPGDEAWDEAGYWDELDVNTFMLNLDPVTALAKLGKIVRNVSDEDIEAAMTGKCQLLLTKVVL